MQRPAHTALLTLSSAAAAAGPRSYVRFVVVLVLASAVAGCFTVTTSSSFTQKELTKKAEVAVATPTMQADVHKSLGEPWISSERWRVEVYRKTGSYRELLVTFGLLPFPIPAPIPLPKEDLTGYTLVTYSAAGVVEGVDTAISKYPDSPLADIQAGDFAFTEKKPLPGAPTHTALQALIVSHERFAATNIHSCTILVGCSGIWCMSDAPLEMQLDGDTSSKYLLGTFGYPLVPLLAEPGAHTLHFSAAGKADWGEVSTPFTCPASELRYVLPSALIRRTYRKENLFWPRSRLEGTVQIQNDLPTELKHSGVLLWTNGRWLVER
jgi:hypothetical protein